MRFDPALPAPQYEVVAAGPAPSASRPARFVFRPALKTPRTSSWIWSRRWP